MEDKQLNLSRPLLSVRRFSSNLPSERTDRRRTDNSVGGVPPLPFYKSELKSGPVRNPGAVPFNWEQIPGRPKDESRPQTEATAERPPVGPKLPPGRILKAKHQDSDKTSEDTMNSLNVQARKATHQSRNPTSLDEHVPKCESYRYAAEDEESSELGDSEEKYLDALDTLTRSESFFLNCSVSGVSGLDGPDVKPSGTFSTDPQTRDFMMCRFLPAAKAMTSEAPRYTPRKQPVVWEQPREVKNVVNGVKQQPALRYGRYDEENWVEEEASDNEYDEHRNLSASVCGLLPRFCLKNSFYPFNPVPGMSVRTRVPMSPVTKPHAFSPAGSFVGTEDENANVVAANTKRSVGGLEKTQHIYDAEKVLKNETHQITHQSDYCKLQGTSLYRRLQGSSASPPCNESIRSPSFCESKKFLAVDDEVTSFSFRKQDYTSFRDLLAQSSNNEMESESDVFEKTLYVDKIHKVESPTLSSRSLNVKELARTRKNEFETLQERKGIEEPRLVDSSPAKIKDDGTESQRNALKSADFSLESSAHKLDEKPEMDNLKGLVKNQDLCKDSITGADLKAPRNTEQEIQDQQAQKAEISHQNFTDFPVPPPLPKSPSDSWLCRTLPSVSSKNPSLRSVLGMGVHSRNQALKTSTVDPKWETIVKTTKAANQHLWSSEELLTPIPENQ